MSSSSSSFLSLNSRFESLDMDFIGILSMKRDGMIPSSTTKNKISIALMAIQLNTSIHVTDFSRLHLFACVLEETSQFARFVGFFYLYKKFINFINIVFCYLNIELTKL